MKLEYLYNNNNNLKHTIKAFFIIGVASIFFYFLKILFNVKHINCSLFLIISLGIIVVTVICNIISALIIVFLNNYKRKQFFYIKNNGSYYEGEIIMASYHHKGYNKHNWILKDSGNIVVCVNDKTYTISDVDYNKEFKDLKQKLSDNADVNKKQLMHINTCFKNTGVLNKGNLKNITIGIYVLEDKAVADLDSIKMK